MATQPSDTISPEVLLQTIKQFYNHPVLSDVILTLNGEKYHLISNLIAQYAPLLHMELEIQNTNGSKPTIDLTTDPEKLLMNLSAALTRTNKKIVNLTIPGVSKETVGMVLETLYGKSFEITLANFQEVHLLSTKFGMGSHSKKCTGVLKTTITPDTIVESYERALSEKSHLEPILKNKFYEILPIIPRDKLMDFISRWSYEAITELVSKSDLDCTEDLVYDIVDRWCQAHENTNEHLTLTSLVKLELLSNEILVTKVKTNDYVYFDTYLKVIESNLLTPKVTSGRRRSKAIFALGKLRESYDGYRLITKTEVETAKFVQMFTNEYRKLDGIMCLDSFAVDLVCCSTHNLQVGAIPFNNILQGGCQICREGESFGLLTRYIKASDISSKIDTITIDCHEAKTPQDNAGIFVLNQMVF